MADLFGIGTSALLSLQKALTTTGDNIANVNTPGYSRQTAEFATLPPQGSSGAGVTIADVRRNYDAFAVAQVNEYTASSASLEIFSSLTGRLDNLLADANAGLAPAMGNFFNAMQDVANNPTGTAERQVLLGEAENLVMRFQYLDQSLVALEEETSSRIRSAVQDINSIAGGIARLNQDITAARAAGGGVAPNSLLDQRDQLLQQLSQWVDVTSVEQADGALNVFIGSGQPLVVGNRPQALTTVANGFDARRLEIATAGSGGVSVSGLIKSGKLGGLLDFRNQVLDPARAELGRVALALSTQINAQHQQGLDLNGQPGGAFFSPLGGEVLTHAANSGGAAAGVTIDNLGALKASDYQLFYDGSQWTLSRLSDGYSVNGAGPFSLDGITVSVSGTAVAGDRFLVRPVSTAAQRIGTQVNQAADIAAGASLANGGTGGVGDNTNMLAMANLAGLRFLDGGRSSLSDAYGGLVAFAGVKARQAEISHGTESTLLAQAQAARESASGVNLDEEAAKLLAYQQAYQAAAQIISVADSLFQTLIGVTRRG